jgi:hypothetical protein
MAERNYLVGFGERLVRPISLKSGGGEKLFPYTFDEARERLSGQFMRTAANLEKLPALACPDGQTVVAFTLHPAFLARSYYPGHLFEDLSLHAVGSRARPIIPERLTRDVEMPSASPELFVAGRRKDFVAFANSVSNWLPSSATQDDFRKIETVQSLDASRLKPIPDGDGEEVPLEVVLHASERDRDDFIVDGFREYARHLGLKVDPNLRLYAGGLCFQPMNAPRSKLKALAAFSFVRVLRRMPRLSLNDSVLRTTSVPGGFQVTLPEGDALSANIRVAVFDGGIPAGSPVSPWVRAREPAGVGAPSSPLLSHGLAVTSALLFGPLESDVTAPTPYAKVDHWRVIDRDCRDDDFELTTVLRRILGVLRQRKYDFVNLSIGPSLPIEDDDVHVWTSSLDQYLANGNTVLVSACGNTGEDDWDSGNARIQPCADAVNGIGVGAATSRGPKWSRASYSSIGPGRSPGFIKPDFVSFGGTDSEPFWLLDHRRPGYSMGRKGTSYAAPNATRSGVGAKAHFGEQLSAAAIKALMIHHARRGNKHLQREVGWGRMPSDLERLVICRDGEVTIVFQGLLEPSQFIRFPIPVPRDPLKTTITIKATFCFFTRVDPEDSLNYTRAGLGIVFRPNTAGHPGYNTLGKVRGAHPSKGFFRSEDYYSTEMERRRDAHKWETIVRAERRFSPGQLQRPVFDVEHHARMHGGPAGRRGDVPYALIVSLSSETEPDLYNRILAAYPNQLEILQPTIEIPVQVRP